MVELDGTVEEVKNNIREASNPDYEELLEKEKEGKNRKTIKKFLQKKADSDTSDESEEEIVEEIEEETEGGILGGYTKPQVMAGGAILGILISMVIVMPALDFLGGQQASNTVQGLLDSSESSAEVTNVQKTGFYNVTLQDEITRNNQTETMTQNWFITADGKKLIPEVVQTPLGAYPVVRDVENLQERSGESQTSSNNEEDSTTNSTTSNSNNTTSDSSETDQEDSTTNTSTSSSNTTSN